MPTGSVTMLKLKQLPVELSRRLVVVTLLLLVCSSRSLVLSGDLADAEDESYLGLVSDNVAFDAPIFTVNLEKNYYVMKNKPANLTCRVRNADYLNISCEHEPSANFTVTRIPIQSNADSILDYELEASILVRYGDVFEFFAECSCKCYASRNISMLAFELPSDSNVSTSSTGTGANANAKPGKKSQKKPSSSSKVEASSQVATVKSASLQRNFNQEPIDTTTEIDAQSIVLQCRPPDGSPTPEVYWTRDGRQIDPLADTNFVVANDGNLILSRAREYDSGSYVCVAHNIAGMRKTQPAKLVVVVNGGWSPWTTWQACTKKCGSGTQKRLRECNQPRPRNGGRDCEGAAEEKRNCTGTKCGGRTPMVTDDWSDWSDCEACVQTRRRLCKDDSSRSCAGKTEEVQTQNCCQNRLPDTRDELALQSTEKPEENKQLIFYIAIPVATTILLVVCILVIVLLVRRARARARLRLYGINESDSTRCLKLGKNGASKNQHGEPIPSGFDILMNPTAQLISDTDNIDAPYSFAQNSSGNGAPAVHESHFLGESHFAFCAPHPDAQQTSLVGMPQSQAQTQAQAQAHADAAMQSGAPYFVPLVGPPKQKQIATTNLPNGVGDPAMLHGNISSYNTNPNPVRGVLLNNVPVAAPVPVPVAVSSQPPLSAVSNRSAPHSHSSASSYNVPPNNNSQPSVNLYDVPETNILSVSSTMRLPPSIAIPPPPPASARGQTGFKLSLRPSANGPELTLAGSHCRDNFNCGSESRTDITMSEFSSMHSETEAEMSEFCDNQLSLLRTAYNSAKNEFEIERVASPNFVCCATVDRRDGCTLCIDHSGISVIVPEMAFETSKLDFLVSVLREDCEQPKLANRETLLSPIVQLDCGYTDSCNTLSKPCVLTIPHCAILDNGDVQKTWRFSVYHCTNFDWQPVAVIDQNGSVIMCNSEVSCQVDVRVCHIVTARFGKYCLVGESSAQCQAAKSLQLAAFARNLSSTIDHKLRVYAIEDHPEALDMVVEIEARLGSFLIDVPKRLAFADTGDNLCLALEQINPNWKIRPDCCYQEIPFRHVWNSHEKLHCSFSFEPTPHPGAVNDCFQCTISVCQKNKFADRERLHIVQPSNYRSHSSSAERVVSNSQAAMIHTPNNSNTSGVASCSCIDGGAVPAHGGLSKQTRLLAVETRAKLCALLDECNGYRADWRMLGQQLGIQQCVLNMVAGSASPTAMLLNLFEAQGRNNEQALQNLYALFRNLGRSDCAAVIENEIRAHIGRNMIC